MHILTQDVPRRVTWPRVWFLALACGIAILFALEVRTSWLQAKVFSAVAKRMTYSVEPGSSSAFWHPNSGPYDVRLGHSQLGEFVKRLQNSGYDVTGQARLSNYLTRLSGWGLFPAYREKPQAGLRIFGQDGELLYSIHFPQRIYRDFREIPPIVINTILYIENRELLDEKDKDKNPAVEWDRLGKATLAYGISLVYPGARVSGGSTLATQMEKFRHSPGGRTQSAGEKMRQMASASLRAYLDGENTLDARRRIASDYLNSVPLAARAGFGEIHGLGDGMWAWFGADFDKANEQLAGLGGSTTSVSAGQGLAYRQMLTLLLAVKKPGAYLIADSDRDSLQQRLENYLTVLARDGVISPALRDRAKEAKLAILNRAPSPPSVRFADRKGRDAVRIELLDDLGLQSTYDLDRLDLDVNSTLDAAAQKSVTEILQRLTDPVFAESAGLRQDRMLLRGDPAAVIYSVTIYERGPGYNRLRVQADNYDQPLNINEGTKLELGSTAKLRTMISYLGIVAELHSQYAGSAAASQSAPPDRLTQWAIAWLDRAEDRSLPAMLEAAMTRTHSASPGEAFFTGGGLHTFSNFEPKDNVRVMTVREAFQRSVNLVFIRLMRDIAQYHTYRLSTYSTALLNDGSNPGRRAYLTRFADREGSQFLTDFYQKYEGLKPDEALQKFVDSIYKTPKRLAVIYRSVRPEDGLNGFAAFLIANTLNPNLREKLIGDLYESYARDKFNLNDRAFLANVHPLELWLVEYKSRHPQATLSEALKESAAIRQEAYQWMFKGKNKSAQDRAIRILLEVEAFERLHRDWKLQGYPFARLVPSFATAIGTSGDTPGALAELMGVILNGGVRFAGVRIDALRFAAGTPFETSLAHRSSAGERVLPRVVAEKIETELAGVVEKGTGRRALGAIAKAGGPDVVIGGKTGTGDNRFETYARGGRTISSRAINRTATFVFYIGDRLFGTITAFVPGEQAAAYEFTSSLPVQIFVELAPTLSQMLETPAEREAKAVTVVARKTG